MFQKERFRNIDNNLLKEAEFFHGILAPGLYLGFFMIEKAREILGPCEMIDAVSETVKCLPDSIQLMTPCTVGNGWLKVFDYGNFALTLYDKKTKEGVRVWIDADKIPKDSVFYKWFMHENKHEEIEILLKEIEKFKDSLFSFSKVSVDIKKEKGMPLRICRKCKEVFPVKDENDLCGNCRGKTYWF